MKKNKEVYLDNASTTRIDQKVLREMLPYLSEKYGNPSSLHYQGRVARNAIEKSRETVASILGSEKDEIIFTSGGTESDNLAILGIAEAYKNKGKHIIVSNIEHKAVLEACKKLEKDGFEITYLDVDKNGMISLEQLRNSMRKDTILVSVMYANNEIGTIEPIKKISKIIKGSKISNPVFHTDACQAVQFLPVNVKNLGVDAMTISASKIYGPKGVGILYLRYGVNIEPVIIGGGQERNKRSGTENIVSIVGIAKALKISENKKNIEKNRLAKLCDYFLSKIKKEIKGVSINGGIKNRLPNNINISIDNVEGESLVLTLDSKGIYCSTGSACSSTEIKPSYVLTNIGVSAEKSHCSIRFSLGRYNKKSDIDYTVKCLVECVNKLRNISTTK